MTKKGFVISFDALLALLLLMTLLIITTNNLGNISAEANNSILLKEVAMDSITVLDKSGRIEKAIEGNSVSGLRAFLNRLPYSLCADLRIYSESDLSNPVLSVLRPDCKKNFLDSATVKRSAVFENGGNAESYLAELRAWYRVVE